MSASPSVGLLTVSVAAPMILAGVLGGAVPGLDRAAAALILVLVIVVVSLRGAWLADLLVVAASAASFDFFLTAPLRSFKIHSSADAQVTVVLLLVGVAIGGLSMWGRARDTVATTRDTYLDEVVQASTGTVSRQQVIAMITDLLDADEGVWVDGKPTGADAVVKAPDALTLCGTTVNPSREGLPTDAFICFPASQGYVRVAAASRRVRPSPVQMRTACLLAAQLRPWTESCFSDSLRK